MNLFFSCIRVERTFAKYASILCVPAHTDVFLQGLRVMYPINAAAVIIEERMHMTGEPYSVLCDSEEMIVAVFF